MYPLFLVVFGRSQATIVMMGFLAALPALILKTLEGLSSTRPVLLDVAKSLKLHHTQTFMKVLLPAALPSIFSGLRIGLTFALINIVGVEFLINFGGLGQLVNELAERYDLPGTYAAIGYVILVSVLLFYAMDRMERLVRPGA
jgi:NitT/TauT family transport system permease protein